MLKFLNAITLTFTDLKIIITTCLNFSRRLEKAAPLTTATSSQDRMATRSTLRLAVAVAL